MNELINSIKKLRKISGAGFLDCKKVLKENDNDIEKSIDSLRKKGLAKASKKSLRKANDGAVGIFFNKNKALLLEINTETDFAAKNDIFLNFFEKIGNFALDINNNSEILNDDFMSYSFEGLPISEHFTDIISKIGENIVLNKINIIKIDSNTRIFSYTHNCYRKNIGKICVALKVETNSQDSELEQFGKNLCMHIAASKPLAIDIDNLDKEVVEKEKEIQKEAIKSSGKPDHIVNKILEGKMIKFYTDVTLYNQNYVLDSEKTVKNVIDEFSSNINFNIVNYSLLVLGNE